MLQRAAMDDGSSDGQFLFCDLQSVLGRTAGTPARASWDATGPSAGRLNF